MAPALHTSTTDRLGPALALAAPGSRLHSDAFSSPSHSGSPSLLFFQFLPRGPSGLPSLGDEPQNWPHITMPAGPQHTSSSAVSLQPPAHPPFTLIPGKATLPGLGIWLELGSRRGGWGQKAKVMVGMKMWRGWARWFKTHKKMSAIPGGDTDDCIEGWRGQDCE